MPYQNALKVMTNVATIRPVVIENILASLPIGLAVINPDGDLTYTNPSFHEILGTLPEDFLEKGWGEVFFHKEQNIPFNQLVIDAIREKKVNLHKEVYYTNPSGKTLRLSMTTSLLQENGHVVNLVVLIADITEVHQARQRERRTLEEKNRVQRERAESLRNLALSVAHQIRNPLMLIGGFATRMIKKAGKKDPNRIYMESILEGTLRLETIVKAVREYADLLPPAPKKIDLIALLRSARKHAEEKARERPREIQWREQLQVSEIQGDPELLMQAFEALLMNSLEAFSGNHGSVELSLTKGSDGIHVRISDSGNAISQKDLPYIFDPFFSTKPTSVGMGLCKAERIIREHKGRIAVKSKEGEGTVVTVHLPAQNN